MIGDGHRDSFACAFGAAALPLLPALVARDEGGAGDAGYGERHARHDEKQCAPTRTHIGTQSVEEMSGWQEPRIPDDQGTGTLAQGKDQRSMQLLRIANGDTKEMRQVNTECGGTGREKAMMGIKEEDRVRSGDGGEEAVQKRRDARSLRAGDEMGMMQW